MAVHYHASAIIKRQCPGRAQACKYTYLNKVPFKKVNLNVTGYIPTAWEIAILCMLLKPDKLPTVTTSYRPISLISSIMKLFERVIEQRLGSHL